ncbi:MAG: cytosine permease [Bacillota bacterium]|jgi:cytosine permease
MGFLQKVGAFLGSSEDFPLGEVPQEERKGYISMGFVLLGFTFFTSTMFAGAQIGSAYKFWPDLVLIICLGNFLLGSYVALLSYIAQKTGYNSVVLCRYTFGDFGSKYTDFIFGVTQIGWYAWGTAAAAMVFTKMLGMSEVWLIPGMIFFGYLFCTTSYIGYRGINLLSNVAVPAMLLLIIWSLAIGWKDVGGFQGLQAITPQEPITFAAALTVVFGSFVSGGTQSTNWSRFSKTASIAVITSMAAFFFGNGLMIFIGAFGGFVYQQPDMVEVLLLQGLWIPALIMLFFNMWTTQDNAIYCCGVAGCNFFRSNKRRMFTFIAATLSTILAIFGMYNWLIPYIVVMGTIIPPVGGIIMADFFYKYRRRMPRVTEVKFAKFNFVGITAYVIGALFAYFSPGVPPINGIVSAFIAYIVIEKIFDSMKLQQDRVVVVEKGNNVAG